MSTPLDPAGVAIAAWLPPQSAGAASMATPPPSTTRQTVAHRASASRATGIPRADGALRHKTGSDIADLDLGSCGRGPRAHSQGPVLRGSPSTSWGLVAPSRGGSPPLRCSVSWASTRRRSPLAASLQSLPGRFGPVVLTSPTLRVPEAPNTAGAAMGAATVQDGRRRASHGPTPPGAMGMCTRGGLRMLPTHRRRRPAAAGAQLGACLGCVRGGESGPSFQEFGQGVAPSWPRVRNGFWRGSWAFGSCAGLARPYREP